MNDQNSHLIRAAAVQMDIQIGDNAGNLARVLERLDEAARNGAQLVVFPECALSGYCFGSLEESKPYTTGTHAIHSILEQHCFEWDVTCVIGYLEDAAGPTDDERTVLLASLARFEREFAADPDAARRFLAAGESPRLVTIDRVEHAALMAVASLVLNLDETVTKE